MVGKYRKLPVVVEAIQFTEENKSEVLEFITVMKLSALNSHGDPALVIPTPEGDMIVQMDDWVIKGVKGDFYPCEPSLFAKIYEAVTEG